MGTNNTGSVYAIRNIKNNKIYIGGAIGSSQSRWNAHLRDLANGNHNLDFQNDWNSSTPDDWQFTVLETDIPCNVRGLAETYWIQKFDTGNPEKGYNLVKAYTRDWTPQNIKTLKMADGIISDITNGMTYRSIAKKYGVSLGTIGNIRNDLCPELKLKREKHRTSQTTKEKIISMIKDGHQIPEICKTLNVNRDPVCRIRKKEFPNYIKPPSFRKNPAEAVRLLDSGKTYRQVRDATGFSLGTISRIASMMK